MCLVLSTNSVIDAAVFGSNASVVIRSLQLHVWAATRLVLQQLPSGMNTATVLNTNFWANITCREVRFQRGVQRIVTERLVEIASGPNRMTKLTFVVSKATSGERACTTDGNNQWNQA